MVTPIIAFLTKTWVLVAIAIVVVGGGYLAFGDSGTAAPTLTIERQDYKEEVAVTGTVVAAEHVDLGFSEGGRISGVYAKVGGQVSAGAVLATIENGDLVSAVAQKEAALETERAKLLALEEGTRPEKIAIDEAAVAKAEVAVRDAIKSGYVSADDAVRKKVDQFFINPRSSLPTLGFVTTNGIIKQRVEQGRVAIEDILSKWSAALALSSFITGAPEEASREAKENLNKVAAFLGDVSEALAAATTLNASYQADINTARATIASAISTLTTAVGTLATARGDLALSKAGSTAADLAAQRAQVRAAEANVASAKVALAKTIVRAPFSGVVSRMDVKLGQIVSAHSGEITLLSTGVFQIETYVAQIDVSSVEPGDSAVVTLDAYGPSVEFSAKVQSVDPAETVREGVTTYKTVLRFDTTDPRIRSGMSANVVIVTGERAGAIVIPRGAIWSENGHFFVTLAETNERREVTLGGEASLGRIEVVRGLDVGDVILLTP